MCMCVCTHKLTYFIYVWLEEEKATKSSPYCMKEEKNKYQEIVMMVVFCSVTSTLYPVGEFYGNNQEEAKEQGEGW